MRILRHAQISMTMDVYTEIPDDITRAALKKLGDSLGGGSAPRTGASPSFTTDDWGDLRTQGEAGDAL